MSTGAPPKQSITSTTDKALDNAIDRQVEDQGPSEAKQQVKHVAEEHKGSGGDGGDPDTGKILKLVGGVVAVVAVIALGTRAVKGGKSRKEKTEEETSGILDGAGRSLRNTSRWFGEKAEVAKDKAGEVADDVGPRVKGAAGATKDKIGEVIPSSVSNAASSAKERANIAGIKAEREGLKASESSDAAVRDAADKLIHTTGRAAEKADVKSGGFFSSLRGWLADRKDEVADTTESFVHKVESTVKGN